MTTDEFHAAGKETVHSENPAAENPAIDGETTATDQIPLTDAFQAAGKETVHSDNPAEAEVKNLIPPVPVSQGFVEESIPIAAPIALEGATSATA